MSAKNCSGVTVLDNIELGLNITMGITGFLGNMLVGIVIHLKMRRNNPNVMLKAMSIAHMFMMLLLLAMTLTYESLTTARVVFLLFSLSRFVSEWILVYVSCARSVSFIWPAKAVALWSNLAVYGSICAIVMTGILLRIPTTVLFFHGGTSNKNYLRGYELVHNVFVEMVAMLFLLVSLIMMVIKTRLSSSVEQQHIDERFAGNGMDVIEQIRNINNITMVLGASLLICHLPVLAENIFLFITHLKHMEQIQGRCLHSTVKMFPYAAIALNSTIQIFSYIGLSKKFRNGLKDFF